MVLRACVIPLLLALPSCGAEPKAPASHVLATSTNDARASAAASEAPKSPQLAARKPRWTLAAPQKPGAAFVVFPPAASTPVVVLGEGGRERGFIVDGVRHRTREAAVERVQGESVPVSRVDVLPEKLGGGLIFGGPGGVYRARTFDGPLRKIAPLDPAAPAYMFGHGVVIVGDKAYDWDTGKARPADPEARVIVHVEGYSVTVARGRARFSKDGIKTTDLGIDGVSFAAARESAIVLQAKDEVFSVGIDGKLTKQPGTQNVLFAIAKTPVVPFDPASLPAALAGSAWVDVPASRGSSVASYQAGELVEVELDSTKASRRSLSIKRDDCGLLAQGADRLLLCGGFAEDRSMNADVYRIDLATADVVLERIDHIEGDALRGSTFVGVANGVAEGAFVLTHRTCQGEANSKRMCVRRAGGKWINVELPRNSQVFPFLEGVYAITHRPIADKGSPLDPDAGLGAEQLVVRELEQGTQVLFEPDVRAGAMRALGLDPARSSREQMLSPTSPVSRGAMLPRPGVLRTFEAVPGRSHLFIVDYVLASRRIEVRALEGAFTIADRRILRFRSGALTESGDGGDTWVDVEPPPTGAPKAVDDARCTMNGCAVGPWVRVGWATR